MDIVDNGEHYESLPPELWLKIAYFLKPSSISRLSRTSRYFLSLIRPLLFRQFVPGSKILASFNDAFQLLSSDTDLAASVQTFAVCRKPHFSLLLTSVENMSNLDNLRIDDWALFHLPMHQDGFNRMLKEKSRSLRSLHVGQVRFWHDEFEAPGLESLIWRMTPCK